MHWLLVVTVDTTLSVVVSSTVQYCKQQEVPSILLPGTSTCLLSIIEAFLEAFQAKKTKYNQPTDRGVGNRQKMYQ